MSWNAVGNFLKSKWVKEQSPIVVVLIIFVTIDAHNKLVDQPTLSLKIEEQQTKQVDRISTEFKEVRLEQHELIQVLLRGKVAEASKEVGRRLSASVSAESDDVEDDP